MKVSSYAPIKFVFRSDSGCQNASCAIAIYSDLEVKFGFKCDISPALQWQKLIDVYGMPLYLRVSPPCGTLEMSLSTSTYQEEPAYWVSEDKALVLTASYWEWDGRYASLYGGMSGVGDWLLPAADNIRVDAGSFAPSFTYPRINVSQYREMLQKFRDRQLEEDYEQRNSSHLELEQEQIDKFWQSAIANENLAVSEEIA